MENFIAGQRWISNTESELGLGLIVESSFNRVSVLFLACDEKRIYAADNAPLTRVKFSIGDNIESVDEEKLTVLKVTEKEGILTYICKNKDDETIELEEMDLSHHSQFNKPQDRLFTGQTDPNAWFSLRYETWQRLQQHAQSPVKGLLGVRAALIPHQIFIAHEAANRAAPRIMLADEVGLGKTIEAGLIIHHRLINNLSKRILIIVPESLLHQWLVEMLRRFNLKFSIFDEMRCLSEIGDDGFDDDEKADLYNQANPFLSEQLILCSQSFFSHYPNRQEQALDAGWDLVIVDEAHHLEWSETAPSSDYLFVEQLGQISPSLILLTATPEQLGKESHFARLRLLDPDRFYSFAAFLEEEKSFEPVANAAKSLLADKPLTDEEQQALAILLKDDNVSKTLENLNDAEKSAAARQTLINILLDHHGTGRILFRNSRQTVQGFPEREYFGYPLASPPFEGGRGGCALELQSDPRYLWLVEKIKQLAGKKALLICKHAKTAMDLEDTLKMKAGISSAVFHEHMTIIERDRAAAYFADEESSARLLICSEIGSEGRNFQFLQHLILWDLPQNPDLLQQRIGRLDRIGQKHVIQIHVPYLENTEQAILYRWYDEGLNAFRANNSAAQHVADLLNGELLEILKHIPPSPPSKGGDISVFIEKTHTLSIQIEAELNHGRDQLLELNSCRKEIADDYIAELSEYENEGTLWDYMEEIFDCYGVDTEEFAEGSHTLTPSEHLRCETFPYLNQEDGLSVTISRAQALAREELQFLTWEHPLVSASMDMVLSSETGNATLSSVKNPDLKAGQFLLECLFVVEHSAPAELQINRFLPSTPIRVLINQLQKDVTAEFSHESLRDCGANFDKHAITVFLNKQRNLILKLLGLAELQAQIQKDAICQQATKTMLDSLTTEIKRLVRLQKVNLSIKNDEIEDLKDKTLLIHENIEIAQLRLDAVRFIITR